VGFEVGNCVQQIQGDDLVGVAAPLPSTAEEPSPFEVAEREVDGPLGDPERSGDLAYAQVRLVGEEDEQFPRGRQELRKDGCSPGMERGIV